MKAEQPFTNQGDTMKNLNRTQKLGLWTSFFAVTWLMTVGVSDLNATGYAVMAISGPVALMFGIWTALVAARR
jgi:hypothetical protein